MKTTGITRRIDELGRVVIPKEIRKNMHIKKGELLEIFLSDKETISLKKYNVINKNQTFIKEYINCLASKINCNIYITNMDEIIFSTKEEAENEKISKELEAFPVNSSDTKYIYITKNIKINEPYNIYPINPNGDQVGFIIFEYKEHTDFTNHELISFSVLFIENYLETK